MSETRDSSPIAEEVRFIEECPHCDSSLADYMRNARVVHIERCEKRQIETVKSWPEEKQFDWYMAKVRKAVPSAITTCAAGDCGLWHVVDNQFNSLSKAWPERWLAWREAWARLYSAQWAEYRQKIKDQHLNRFAEKHGLEVKTPAERDEDEGNRTQAAVRGEIVGMSPEEFNVSMGSYVVGILNEATGRRSVDELGIEENPKECPKCGNMNLGDFDDCVCCEKKAPYRELPVVGKSLCSKLNEELKLKVNAAKEYVFTVYPNAKVIYPTEIGNIGMGYRIQGQTKEGHLMDLSVINEESADSYTHNTEEEAWIKAASNVEEIEGLKAKAKRKEIQPEEWTEKQQQDYMDVIRERVKRRGLTGINADIAIYEEEADDLERADCNSSDGLGSEDERRLNELYRLIGELHMALPKEDRHPEQIPMAGGKAASSKIPPFHLIPTVGLRRLAERFALGIERKGDKAWNALSSNQEVLSDKEFLIERLGHIIDHATKLRDKVMMKGPFKIGDDDAAAIAWAGMYAICATDMLQWTTVLDERD